jgi:hypothetical protein
MMMINAAFTNSLMMNRTFVIRLAWDELTATWCILLKSVDGKEVRLFPDVESACLYLEALMRDPNAKRPAERR